MSHLDRENSDLSDDEIANLEIEAEPAPIPISGKTVNDLYGRLVAIESRLKGLEEHLYSSRKAIDEDAK